MLGMIGSDEDYLEALAGCEALAARSEAPEARHAIRTLADAMAQWERDPEGGAGLGGRPAPASSRASARVGASMRKILAVARHAHATARIDDNQGFRASDAVA